MNQLLQNKNFLQLLLGYALSVFVDSVVFMVSIKQVEILSNSSWSYTGLYLFHFLPSVLFSVWIGAWISSKKIVSVMKNTLLIRLSFLIVFIVLSGLSSLSMLYIFIFAESLLAAFFLPSTDTLVTKIVNKEKRAYANATIKLFFVLMQMIGYGITTIMIKSDFSLYAVLIISVCLIACSVLSISQIRYEHVPSTQIQKVSTEIIQLISYLKMKKDITKLFLLFASAWLIASSIDLIVIAYLTKIANVSSENFGIVSIAVFFGMIVGASLSSQVYEKIKFRYIFSFPLLVYTITVLSMYLFDNWTYTLPFFVLGGISLGLFEVCFTTYLQDNNHEKYYTRIFSIQGTILSSMPLPGLLALGSFISFLGIQNTILIISIFLFLLSIVAFKTKFNETNKQELKEINNL